MIDFTHKLSDCRIRNGENGIHFLLNRDGKRRGDALIEMESEQDVQKALEKHRILVELNFRVDPNDGINYWFSIILLTHTHKKYYSELIISNKDTKHPYSCSIPSCQPYLKVKFL